MNKVLLFALLMTSAVKASDSADQKAKNLADVQKAIALLEAKKSLGMGKLKPAPWLRKSVKVGGGQRGGNLFQIVRESGPQ